MEKYVPLLQFWGFTIRALTPSSLYQPQSLKLRECGKICSSIAILGFYHTPASLYSVLCIYQSGALTVLPLNKEIPVHFQSNIINKYTISPSSLSYPNLIGPKFDAATPVVDLILIFSNKFNKIMNLVMITAKKCD